MPARAGERLAAARAEIDRVCQLLVSPTAEQLDRCAERLAGAIREVTVYRESGPTSIEFQAEDLQQARALETSLRRASRLLEAAAAFHENWWRCVGALCGGYTDRGAPAAVDRGCRILARG